MKTLGALPPGKIDELKSKILDGTEHFRDFFLSTLHPMPPSDAHTGRSETTTFSYGNNAAHPSTFDSSQLLRLAQRLPIGLVSKNSPSCEADIVR